MSAALGAVGAWISSGLELLADAGQRIDIALLAAGLALHLLADAVRNRAWFSILRTACPDERALRVRDVEAAAFAGGGINGLLPARAGDLLKLALLRRRMPGSHLATLTTTLVPETLFELVAGGALLGWALYEGYLPAEPVMGALARVPAPAAAVAGIVAAAAVIAGVRALRAARVAARRAPGGGLCDPRPSARAPGRRRRLAAGRARHPPGGDRVLPRGLPPAVGAAGGARRHGRRRGHAGTPRPRDHGPASGPHELRLRRRGGRRGDRCARHLRRRGALGARRRRRGDLAGRRRRPARGPLAPAGRWPPPAPSCAPARRRFRHSSPAPDSRQAAAPRKPVSTVRRRGPLPSGPAGAARPHAIRPSAWRPRGVRRRVSPPPMIGAEGAPANGGQHPLRGVRRA